MAPSPKNRSAARLLGAYGMAVEGVPGAARLLVPADGWPTVELAQRLGDPDVSEQRITTREARIRLRTGGALTMRREPASATLELPVPVADEALVHPYLAPVTAIMSWWLGREAIHAGAVLVGDGAWGILGDRGSGKSSTLAWLALHGHDVLADDILVVEGSVAYCGPRAVDLRPDAAWALEAGESMGTLGQRERWRLTLPRGATSAPLHGWVTLAWGEEVAMRPVSLIDRLRHVTQHRAAKFAARDPAALLALARVPGWAWTRPRDWERLPRAIDDLLTTLAGEGTRSRLR